MQKESGSYGDSAVTSMQIKGNNVPETSNIEGHYHVICYDKNGNIKWEEKFPNLVMVGGKELLFNTLLRTSGTYTTTGPFLGLLKPGYIPAAADTMSSIIAPYEFTNYTVNGVSARGKAVFSAATSSGTTPTNVTTCTALAISYVVIGAGGIIAGCFLTTGTNAVSAQLSTTGTLYSAGNFTTARVAVNGDRFVVIYSTTATS